MRDVSEWSEGDLNELIRDDVQEAWNLDYKASGALARTDASRNELSKDVAAFANSAGGRIIYGIIEKDQHPKAIDDGVNAREITREWLEQVISTNIQPRIDRLRIYPIALPSKGADRVAYVIDIPQSTSRAPHQSRDNKYYKRYNFQYVAMEDYEIRDIMRRASTPDLWIRFSFDSGDSTKVVVQPGEQTTAPIKLHAVIGNRSATPAEHAVIDIYLDAAFELVFHDSDLTRKGQIARDGREFNVLTRRWSVPQQLPIFAETMLPVSAFMNLAIQSAHVQFGFEFVVGYAIRAPGCTAESFVRMILQNRTLWIPKQASAYQPASGV
jgi:hypothetical protein